VTLKLIYIPKKSNKKINYVECPFMVEYCNNMIALEQCLAFGSLSSKYEKNISKQKITKEKYHKKVDKSIVRLAQETNKQTNKSKNIIYNCIKHTQYNTII
jgi:SOS response regulatory protein OraA/RecX